ncbi:hypothetical protein F5Y16DRAFT_377947 [Xylariaceae sp. FL0255]|nr:hypothetical protein F5Y16DRAFT_377947 [Xylariaceae sp. FL0255]
MSSTKRRKLNSQEARPQSAFALRSTLLRQAEEAPASPKPDDRTTDMPNLIATPTQKIKIKSQVAIVASSDAIPPPPHVSLEPQSAGADVKTTPQAMPSLVEVTVNDSPLSPLDDQDDTGQKLVSSSQTMSLQAPSKLSTWKRTDLNFSRQERSGKVKISLKQGERLVIQGNYRMLILAGEVALHGAVLKPSRQPAYRVCAPNCYALPIIRCTEDAEISVYSQHNDASVDLAKLSPLFRNLWPEDRPLSSEEAPLHAQNDSFRIVYTSANSPAKSPLQAVKAPAEWNRAIATLGNSKTSKASCTMIVGPKSSGKSTFGRVLVNHLLTVPISPAEKVAILDLDPGQPEYGVPGHISLVTVSKPLFSPPCFRPLEEDGVSILRSHSLSSISPMSDPNLYLEMATDLMVHYQDLNQRWPIVINTSGWIQGTGLDLLLSMVRTFHPSDVTYMSETGPAEVVDALQKVCTNSRFMALPSQTGLPSPRTAKQLRLMHTMAYFHSKPPINKSEPSITWVPKPLSTTPPWQVQYRMKSCGILGLMCYDFVLPLDIVADAVCGKILALAAIENVRAFRNIANTTSIIANKEESDSQRSTEKELHSTSEVISKITRSTPEGIPFIDTSQGLTLDPRFSRSLGLVLVRAIDVENGQFHLSTPIPIPQIWKKAGGLQLVLVGGTFDSPVWSYIEDMYYRSRETDDGCALEEADGTNESDTDMADINVDSYDGGTESVPYIEVISGNQKRVAGSKVWRVRRDLGRLGNFID